MQRSFASALVLLLAALAAAGCTGGDGSGFTVKGADGSPGPYVFTAQGSADNYTWDLGDRLTVLYGKRVEHTYDFANGQVAVKLTMRSGEQVETASRTLTLGNGENAEPSLVLEGETKWAVLGEEVRFSGAASTDPDGDAVRFSWNCIRTGDAIRQGVGHSHGPGGGGVPYGTGSAGSVASRVAAAPLPVPDRTVAGDLCEALGAGSRPTLDATIAGRFERTGIYDIIMLASDPKTPTTSGRFTVYVTDPSERPQPIQVEEFNGTFEGGAGGAFQDACAVGGEECDRTQYSFSLPLAGVVSYVNLTFDAGPLSGTPAANVVTVAVQRGENVLLAPSSDPAILENLTASTYTVIVTLEQGAQTAYSVQVTTRLNMDPTQVY